MDEYSAISLCKILEPNSKGNQYAKRLADIDQESGSLRRFLYNDSAVNRLDNLPVIFLSDKHIEYGNLIVLRWRTKLGLNGKPRTKSFEEKRRYPIEIIETRGTKTIDDVLDVIRNGLPFCPEFDEFLICKENACNDLDVECIHCYGSDFSLSNDMLKLKADVTSLSGYLVSGTSIVKFDEPDGSVRCFYNKMSVSDEPYRSFSVFSKYEIIHNEVLNYFPWSRGKQLNLTKKEWQRIRGIIDQFPQYGLIDRIAEQMQCSKETANKSFIDYLKVVDTFVDPSCIDEYIYKLIIDNNEMIKQMLVKICIKEYSSDVNNKKKELSCELNELSDRLIALNNELNIKISQRSEIENNINNLQSYLSEKEKQAHDVEIMVASRIEAARKNAADFISEMAFNLPLLGNPTNNILRIVESPVMHTNELLTDFRAVHDHLADNIEAIGVHEDYAPLLGMFFVTAYRQKQPLLLVGPKSFDIVNTFSESLFARSAAVLDCNWEPSPDVIIKLNSCESEVVIVRHAIQSRWTDYLPDILSVRNKLVIIVHHFIEDLPIEPKSLFSYMMPVFTECLLGGEQTGEILPGVIDFDVHMPISGLVDKVKNIKTKMYNGFMCKKMNDLFKDFCFVSKEADDYDETELRNAFILLVEFPYAYVTSQLQKLKQDVSDFNKKMLLPIAEYFDEIFE